MASTPIDPIHQFQIHPIADLFELGGVKFAFTNSSLFMLIIVALTTFILVAGTASRAMVPGRFQSVAELWYEFVENMVKQVLEDFGADNGIH